MALLSVTLATTSTNVVLATKDNFTSQSIESGVEKLNLSSEKIDKDLNKFYNDLQKEFRKDALSSGIEVIDDGQVGTRSIASKSVKAAAKWLKNNWSKVVSKAPSWLKPYLKISFLGKAIDAYIGVSDTVEEFVYDVLRYILPDFVSSW